VNYTNVNYNAGGSKELTWCREVKSKIVAYFGFLSSSSLLCFFSSFTFLGRLFSLCNCLSASVFIFFVQPPCVVPPVLFSGFLCSSTGFLGFLPLPFFLLCFGPLLWFSSGELRFWCSCCWRWRPGLLGVLDRRKEAYCCGCGPRLLKTTANTQETNRQLLFALLKEKRHLARVTMIWRTSETERSRASGLLAELSAWGRSNS
jgi:hypothetical protein